MQRTLLICVVSSLTLFGSTGYASESLDTPTGPLVPVYISASPVSTSTTYYPSVTAANASPLTVAASTPLNDYRTVAYVADAGADANAVVGAGEVADMEQSVVTATDITPTTAHYAPTVVQPQTTTVYRSVAPAVGTGTTVFGPASPAYVSPATSCCPPTSRPVRVVSYRPVVETAPMPRDYYVGRGMIGQPVVYVPGQPVRNALRWFFP